MMKLKGRKYEVYTTTTEDKWDLTLFRIMPKDGVAPSDTYQAKSDRAVYFQHGGMMDAKSWVQAGSLSTTKEADDISAFFQLADWGYDVWMGNNRGTNYSNENPSWQWADTIGTTAFQTENFQKYDFSWADMGKYDVPAALDKIIEVSGKEKVTYVGYSQGTSQLLYGLSTPASTKIESKLEKAVLLAPCIYFEGSKIEDYMRVYPLYRDEGVNVINKDYWPVDKLNICIRQDDDDLYDQVDHDFACAYAETYSGEPIPVKSLELYE